MILLALKGAKVGTIGEWAAAFTTVAVIVVTLWIRRRDEQAREAKAERAEAARVNCWFQARNPRPENPSGITWQMVVENSSDLVIYAWDAAVWWVRTGEPGGGPHVDSRTLGAANSGPLPPGKQLTHDLGQGLVPNPAQDFNAVIIWQHPAGPWWKRSGGSLLRNETGWPPPWAARPEAPTAGSYAEAIRELERRSETTQAAARRRQLLRWRPWRRSGR